MFYAIENKYCLDFTDLGNDSRTVYLHENAICVMLLRSGRIVFGRNYDFVIFIPTAVFLIV